ncbi:phage minor capsid protein [Streptosporangium sp. NPDC051022]|uniref:phage minor capsid protein n=1 Tax=Streptosporangium sp. NPDC051022 TaxID=3155752 RepID=UPI003430187D
MLVDQDLLDHIAASVADLYRSVEASLIKVVADELKKDLIAPTAEVKLDAVTKLRRAAQAVYDRLQNTKSAAVREAIRQAYRDGHASALTGLPVSKQVRDDAKAALAQVPNAAVIENIANALHRDLGVVEGNILRAPLDAYRAVQAATAARIATGTATRRQASQAAWARLVDQGIVSFTDTRNRRWRLSSYAEMIGRTNAARAAIQGQMDRLASVGIDLVVVSDNTQECKLCRPFESKVLRRTPGPIGRIRVEHGTRDGELVEVHVVDTLDGARAKGFQHPNCRHSVSAFLPGVTRLKTATADPEGDVARQRQRALERKIRAAKEQALGALTPEGKKAANAKVRAAQAALREHLKDNPKLKRLPYREQIGAGNTPGPEGPKGGPVTDMQPPAPPTPSATALDVEAAERQAREAEETTARKKAEAAAAETEAAEKARAEAEARARAEEEAKRAAEAEQARADAEARAEAERKAQAEAEEKARAEAAAAEQARAAAKAQAEAEAKAREEAEARARAEAEAKARAEAEARAKQEAEVRAKAEAEEKARAKAAEKAKREAAKQAQAEAEARARAEAKKAQPSLAERVALGERSRTPLSGGMYGDTNLVTLADGSKVVHKIVKRTHLADDAVDQADAEILGGKVARALGVRAPEVHRVGPKELYIEFMDGKLAEGARKPTGYLTSDSGWRMAFFDALTDYADRHMGNWLLDGKDLVSIDHGLTFGYWDKLRKKVLDGRPLLHEAGRFEGLFMKKPAQWNRGIGEWIDNDMSPDDITAARARLTALRSEFAALGREEWWSAMMARLDAIAPHAKGTRRRIADPGSDG